MRYLGGKTRLAKKIAAEILSRTTSRNIYLEPFVGGGSVFCKLAPHFQRAVASDVHPDLAMMWDAVSKGWVPPKTMTKEQYDALRYTGSSPVRAFAGFAVSFGGKWFGGFARGDKRDFAAEGFRNVMAQVPVFLGREVYNFSYEKFSPQAGTVVYCDPPYRGTTGYSTGDFDHDKFWTVCNKWVSNGARVFVSEYEAPPDWDSVLEHKQNKSVALKNVYDTSVEHLFIKGVAQ